DATLEQLCPEFGIGATAKRQHVRSAPGPRKHLEERTLRELLAPVQAGAADEPCRVRILPRQLPYETQSRGNQASEFIRRRLRDREQVAVSGVREEPFPEIVVPFTKREQQERRGGQPFSLRLRQRDQSSGKLSRQV